MKKYTSILGAGALLVLFSLLFPSCKKESLEPSMNLSKNKMIFLQAEPDSSKNVRNWDKQFNDDENPTEAPHHGNNAP